VGRNAFYTAWGQLSTLDEFRGLYRMEIPGESELFKFDVSSSRLDADRVRRMLPRLAEYR